MAATTPTWVASLCCTRYNAAMEIVLLLLALLMLLVGGIAFRLVRFVLSLTADAGAALARTARGANIALLVLTLMLLGAGHWMLAIASAALTYGAFAGARTVASDEHAAHPHQT